MIQISRRVLGAAIAMALPFFVSAAAVCQSSDQAWRPKQEVRFEWAPNQVTASYRYTVDDYSLQTATGLERSRLNGGELEYSWRRLYPWEIVGTVSYSQGAPLGQQIVTTAGGVGYTRGITRYLLPFARLEAGVSRTSSNDGMYLLTAPQWGFTTVESTGLDVRVSPHWGARAIQIQNEYLPFGSHGSVYWSVGTGISYRFHP